MHNFIYKSKGARYYSYKCELCGLVKIKWLDGDEKTVYIYKHYSYNYEDLPSCEQLIMNEVME